jgi:Uma2 family endonuclease
MGSLPWRDPPLTRQEENDLFMLTFLGDAIEPTWTFGGDLQFWAASSFAHSLRNYARQQRLPWYVASMVPIAYSELPILQKMLIVPDTFVAFVPDREREVFDAAAEGCFPPFILEVISAASEEEDRRTKRRVYGLLGAREYVLFTPREDATSTLEGYQRDAAGAFVTWRADSEGRLWSDVLGLFLVARGPLLQAQTSDGRLLLTLEQAAGELQRSEKEVERLKRELERYRSSK